MKNVIISITMLGFLLCSQTNMGRAQSGWIPRQSGTTSDLYGGTTPRSYLSGSSFAVGTNGTVLTSNDSGTTWDSIPNNVSGSFRAVNFSYPGTGFVVGDSGRIIKLQKIGNYVITDLTSRNPAGSRNLNDVFASLQNPFVLVVGDSGTILRSFTLGETFVGMTSGTDRNLRALAFVDPVRMYAVGDSGTILKGRLSGPWQTKTPPHCLREHTPLLCEF